MAMDVSEIWRNYQTPEETEDDSSKDFTVPANTEWKILWVWVELTSSADVGNRQMAIQVLDSTGDVIGTLARAGAVQANGVTRYYLFAPGVPDLTAFRDTDYLTTPLPAVSSLNSGQVLRVLDNKAIAPAADHMIIQLSFSARAVVQ